MRYINHEEKIKNPWADRDEIPMPTVTVPREMQRENEETLERMPRTVTPQPIQNTMEERAQQPMNTMPQPVTPQSPVYSYNNEEVMTCMGNGNMSEYLCGNMNMPVKIEFMFGNLHAEKTGILRGVGENYVVIEDTATGNKMVCDLRYVKFINIYTYPDNKNLVF
ncbi:MAG: hypothetical protein J6C17_01580 [Clostridia bacterium]|nr:hypothetical protein [Clostridia bacterium]